MEKTVARSGGSGSVPTLHFDLHGAARLAFNYFNHHCDSRTGFTYMWTYLLTDPSKAAHQSWDLVEVTGRSLEGLVPARLMTGSDEGVARERWCLDKLIECQAEDGLIYRPKTAYSVRMADIYDQASALTGLVMLFLADGDPRCQSVIQRCIAGVERYIEWDEKDFARVTAVAAHSNRAVEHGAGQMLEADNPEEVDEAWMGRFITPLVLYAKATSQERLLGLARALARDIALRSGRYGDDGSFGRARHGERSVWTNGHFHSRANTMVATLLVARETGDSELADWAEMVFRWALRQGTSFGWFPEFVGRQDVGVEGCETCGIVDMLEAAILLARAGRTDCWDIADRIWRNQLLEAQLRDISWVKATRTQHETEIESYDHVAERAIGGFAGWSAPNDFISTYPDRYFAAKDPSQDHRRSLMSCCCGTGPKGLYLAWHHALEASLEGITVNLALSRDSSFATLVSHEPYEGLLEVTMKRPDTLRFRTPTKVDPKRIKVTLNGRTISMSLGRGLLSLPCLSKGDTVQIYWPLSEYAETVAVGDPAICSPIEYRVAWRGNTVVAVDPPGQHCPLYRRRAAAEKPAESRPCSGPPAANEIDE